MWKHLLNVKNVLMAVALAALIVVIAGQQSLLDREREAYTDAKAQNEQVQQELDNVRTEREHAGSSEAEEDIARADGYVTDDEIVFVYEQ